MATLKISEMTEADLPLDGTEDIEIVQSALTKRCSTQDIADLSIPYKVYRALVTQASTGIPTAVILENTLGAVPTFARSTNGTYSIDITGALFTANKTFVSPKWSTLRQSTNYATLAAIYANTGQITLTTYLNGTAADDLLDAHPIEIIVYN